MVAKNIDWNKFLEYLVMKLVFPTPVSPTRIKDKGHLHISNGKFFETHLVTLFIGILFFSELFESISSYILDNRFSKLSPVFVDIVIKGILLLSFLYFNCYLI